MTCQTIAYWLLLLRAPGLSLESFYQLIRLFPDLADCFVYKDNLQAIINLSSQTLAYLKTPDWKSIEPDLEWLASNAHHFIVTYHDSSYPLLLKETVLPPPVLFVKGNLAALNNPQLAIIGSRTPSPGGKKIAVDLASKLACAGLTITSGLARGIDAAAHQGALNTGQTIAVVGTGLNLHYPKENWQLAEKISHKGAILSEFCYGTPPRAHHFPRRNRLISGLSLGTLVVEANLKSGSLITAAYALEQGREVLAVPGSIYNPRARGCHLLIKQGATLVENEQDVLEALRILPQLSRFTPQKAVVAENKILEDDHLKLLECIGYEPTKIDILVERSNYPISKVTDILVDLELTGRIDCSLGGYMRVS